MFWPAAAIIQVWLAGSSGGGATDYTYSQEIITCKLQLLSTKKMTDNVPPAADEQAVLEWATAHKISPDSLKALFKDGFTSLESIRLLEKEDLSHKIPRGQQRLILHAVGELRKPVALSGESHHQDPEGPVEQEPASEPQDPYVRTVLSGYQAAQGLPQPTEAPATGTIPVASTHSPVTQSTPAQNHSWQDAQVFLRMAAGKGPTPVPYYDITDFASLTSMVVREEVVSSGPSGAELVWRTGPRKPKLSSLTIPQWSVANLAILSRLQDEGRLDATSTLDYLSYTTRIYQLLQRYDQVSVYLYDCEYRRLQTQMGFRWGTEVSHLQAVWLKEQGPRTNGSSTGATISKSTKAKGPTTIDGLTICKMFNSRAGCTFADCKFTRVCSRPGCEAKHSAIAHDSSAKN